MVQFLLVSPILGICLVIACHNHPIDLSPPLPQTIPTCTWSRPGLGGRPRYRSATGSSQSFSSYGHVPQADSHEPQSAGNSFTSSQLRDSWAHWLAGWCDSTHKSTSGSVARRSPRRDEIGRGAVPCNTFEGSKLQHFPRDQKDQQGRQVVANIGAQTGGKYIGYGCGDGRCDGKQSHEGAAKQTNLEVCKLWNR